MIWQAQRADNIVRILSSDKYLLLTSTTLFAGYEWLVKFKIKTLLRTVFRGRLFKISAKRMGVFGRRMLN